MPEPSAVSGWYRAYFDELVRLAYLASGDAGAAEDAVQEVFAECLRRPPTLTGAPLPYLRSAVLNRSRSRTRRQRRGRELTERIVERPVTDATATELPAIRAAQSGPIADAVRRLPERQRDIVILRYWLDLSEAEIAETLGISPGTVKSSSSRARTTLAPILEQLR